MPRLERVVMVTPRFHPEVGGVETHVYETGRRLVAQGVDLTVLPPERRGALPAVEMLDGIRVRRVRAWPADRDYRFAPGILRALARERCDVVHCQGYHTLVAPLAMLAAIAGGTPLIVSFHSGGHSSLLRHRLRAVHQRALRPLLTRARRLIAVSRFEAELFQRRLRIPLSRYVIIPN